MKRLFLKRTALLFVAMLAAGQLSATFVTVSSESITGWSINNNSTFHINTWSTEGNDDGSGMTNPFLENWVSSGKTLPEGKWSYTVKGLKANATYTMSAWVRAYNENSETDPSGVTIYAGSVVSEDISTGSKIKYDKNEKTNTGRYAQLRATGVSNSRGELTIGVNVTAGKVNWVAMKDIKLWLEEESVNLGLPSGTLWSGYNLGASSTLDSGNCYAWADTSTRENYDWSSYGYRTESGGRNLLTKYCTDDNYGTADGETELESGDDAASVNRGAHWRMPDSAQFAELLNEDYTTCVWTSFGGVYGLLVTSKSNGNSIFIPAAGYKVFASGYDFNQCGYYWSKSLFEDNCYGAAALFFDSGSTAIYYFSRCRGMLIRPVYVP